jgi:hypothetical protein
LSKNIIINKKKVTVKPKTPQQAPAPAKEIVKIKQLLRAFLEELKKYMEENQLNDDKFLKNLCDDIYISYKTFGTKLGTMFTCARQTSQGTQRCYTSCHIPDDISNNLDINDLDIKKNYISRTPRINRNFNVVNFFDSCIDNSLLPPLEHFISDHADTPYSTPSARQVMEEISSGPQLDVEEIVLEGEIELDKDHK